MTDELTIIHTDPLFIVVEKPGGLLSVPGRGPDKQDCVVNRVKKKFPDCISQPAVHRLDMDTSGLMVLALTKEVHKILSLQFQERLVQKRYVALLDGIVHGESGEIRLAFRLDPANRPHQVFDPLHGKLGISRWRKIKVEEKQTRIEFFPLTGRTHQLRVHSAHEQGLHCPIVGDRLYGSGKFGDQLMLHAATLSFHHPLDNRILTLASPEPF